MSERQVHRALKQLKAAGLVSIVGKTKYDSNVYEVHLDVPHSVTLDATHSHAKAAMQTADACHMVSSDVTHCHGNKGKHVEHNIEAGHLKVRTSPAKAVLAPVQKSKAHPNKMDEVGKCQSIITKMTMSDHPPVPSPPLPNDSDSVLVQTWKAAHKAAGLSVPNVSALEGHQLRQLMKGKHPLDYKFVVESLIPTIVKHWAHFCAWSHVKFVHLGSKLPMPPQPSVGFLLRYKMIASGYLNASEGEKIICGNAMEKLPPKFGMLPKKVPKPKNWHSPIWKGHPTSNKVC